MAAGAIWGPVRCGPAERCYAWARTGLEVLSALAGEPRRRGAPGLRARGVLDRRRRRRRGPDLLADLRVLGARRPAGRVRRPAGPTPRPAVNMPVYLEYLLQPVRGPRRDGDGADGDVA